jgi:hypothetical protein
MDAPDAYGIIVGSPAVSEKWGRHITFRLMEDGGRGVKFLPDAGGQGVNYIHFYVPKGGCISESELGRLLQSVAGYVPSGGIVTSRGGCTPGGLCAIKRLVKYGFEKIGEYTGYDLDWSEPLIDRAKYIRFVNNPKHYGDYHLLDEREQRQMKNTVPIIWILRKI